MRKAHTAVSIGYAQSAYADVFIFDVLCATRIQQRPFDRNPGNTLLSVI